MRIVLDRFPVDAVDSYAYQLTPHRAALRPGLYPALGRNPRCGYGTASDIDFEGVQHGIVVTASNTRGYKFTGVDLNAQTGIGKAAVQVRAGGSMPPKIEINGGSNEGPWALGAYPPPAVGTLQVVNILP